MPYIHQATSLSFYEPVSCTLSPEKLQQALEFFQHALRIQDWNVTVSILRDRDMNPENSNGSIAGCIYHHQSTKCATIYLLDPVDFHPDSQRPYDMLKTLVHESIHLLMYWHNTEPETSSHDAMEQSVDIMAQALTHLYRQSLCDDKDITFIPE